MARFEVDADGGEWLCVGSGGWSLWWMVPDLDVRVRLKPTAVGIAIASISVSDVGDGEESRSVTATDLKRIRLGRIEAAVQSEAVAAAVRRHWTPKSPARFDPGEVTYRDALAVAKRQPLQKLDPKPGLIVYVDESGGRMPDAFYAAIAAAFAAQSLVSASPAQDMAKANKVPVTRVHRWVKEARRRGLLPPAQHRGGRPTAGSSAD